MIENNNQSLIKSAWVKQFNNKNICPILDALNIPYKKGKNKNSFWITNEADLEYIYNDFCKASKKILVELHPDKGGNSEEFKKLNETIYQVKKAFQKRGIGQELIFLKEMKNEEELEKKRSLVTELILQGKKHKEIEKIAKVTSSFVSQTKNSIIKNSTSPQTDSISAKKSYIIELLLKGIPIKKIEKIAKIGPRTLSNIRKSLSLPPCKCGKPAYHIGECYNRIMTEETKKKISNTKKARYRMKIEAMKISSDG